jgi:uncharacterized membrane protein YbhN (UPF0104 family)
LAILWLASVELVKAARWQTSLGRIGPSYAQCLRAVVLAQAANAVIPVRVGELVGIGLVAANGTPAVSAAAALAAMKIIDAVCLSAIAAVVLGAATLGHFPWAPVGLGLLVLAGAGVTLSSDRVPTYLETNPWMRRLRLDSVAALAQTLQDRKALLIITGSTVLVWTGGLAANATVLAAIGVVPTLDLAARVLVAGYLVGLLPAPPARVGVFEAGVVAALMSGGVPLPGALAASVTLHACQLIELAGLFALTLVRTAPSRSA